MPTAINSRCTSIPSQSGGKAAKDYRTLLSYNPNDNQGVRLVLGPLLMIAGDWNGAYAHQAELMSHEDEAHDAFECYDFSLILLNIGDLTKAVMYLRRAMAKNIYIVEVLLGKVVFVPYEIEHLNTQATLEDAVDYLIHRGVLWKEKVPDAVPLLSFLISHKTVCMELSAVYALRHQLYVHGTLLSARCSA